MIAGHIQRNGIELAEVKPGADGEYRNYQHSPPVQVQG